MTKTANCAFDFNGLVQPFIQCPPFSLLLKLSENEDLRLLEYSSTSRDSMVFAPFDHYRARIFADFLKQLFGR